MQRKKLSELVTHFRDQADPDTNKMVEKIWKVYEITHLPINQDHNMNDKKSRISDYTLPQSNTPCNAMQRRDS